VAEEATTAEDTEPLTFVIVGVGGIGTALADDACKMLEYKRPGSYMILVDGDTFEEKNKERQNFGEMGNKAEVKAKELTKKFSATTVLPLAKWVVDEMPDIETDEKEEDEDPDPTTSDSNKTKILVSDLLDEDQVVFAVVDNFKARAIICTEAENYENIDVFMGGNDDGLYGSLYHFQRRGGKNITAPPRQWHPELDDPPDRNPGDLSCEERAKIEGGTQLVATNRMVASLMLGRIQHCILNGNSPEGGASIYFDLADASFGSDWRPGEGQEVPAEAISQDAVLVMD
jgi:hypothetical protein